MNRVLSTALAIILIAPLISAGQDASPSSSKPDRVNRVPDAVFIPTPQDVVVAMLELAAVRPGDVVYDLGCGDGRIVITAAKRYGCRAVGFDIDELRVEQSRQNLKKSQLSGLVRIEHQDVLKLDLRPASVITLYLTPKLNAKLVPQFETLGPGSRIVAHESAIPGVPPDKAVQITSREDGRKHVLYLWKCPLKKEH